jgi:hypothetical protein
LAAAGFREVALTGVHLGSYGRDLEPPATLTTLLQAIVGHAPPEVRFRISSLEPMDCTPAIVDLVASERCLAPHFHLPLQHASNRVLAGMRRPYTIEEYETGRWHSPHSRRQSGRTSSLAFPASVTRLSGARRPLGRPSLTCFPIPIDRVPLRRDARPA